jgi:hypothetical protein
MRAREFVTESRAKLPPEAAGPMHDTYMLPGLRNNDAYRSYRFGVAMARARADLGGAGKDLPKWNTESAMGMYGIVSGFDENVDPVIDLALKMTNISGGKISVSSDDSEEPDYVDVKSPVKAFKGYPR